MTLETVIANLENTIRGKRLRLDGMMYERGYSAQDREYVNVNIDDLERILADLKKINQ